MEENKKSLNDEYLISDALCLARSETGTRTERSEVRDGGTQGVAQGYSLTQGQMRSW